MGGPPLSRISLFSRRRRGKIGHIFTLENFINPNRPGARPKDEGGDGGDGADGTEKRTGQAEPMEPMGLWGAGPDSADRAKESAGANEDEDADGRHPARQDYIFANRLVGISLRSKIPGDGYPAFLQVPAQDGSNP